MKLLLVQYMENTLVSIACPFELLKIYFRVFPLEYFILSENNFQRSVRTEQEIYVEKENKSRTMNIGRRNENTQKEDGKEVIEQIGLRICVSACAPMIFFSPA